MAMKKFSLFFSFLIFSFVMMISCGVSTGETLKASGQDGEIMEAGELPILQVCPIEKPSLKVTEGGETVIVAPAVTNFFVEPVKIEEADNNIIVIETNVDKVSVSLNSNYMGLSKITITDLLPGQFILDLSKDGYESQRNFINVGKDRKSYFYFEMKEKTE